MAPQSHLPVAGFQVITLETQTHEKESLLVIALFLEEQGAQLKVVPFTIRALLLPQSHLKASAFQLS